MTWVGTAPNANGQDFYAAAWWSPMSGWSRPELVSGPSDGFAYDSAIRADGSIAVAWGEEGTIRLATATPREPFLSRTVAVARPEESIHSEPPSVSWAGDEVLVAWYVRGGAAQEHVDVAIVKSDSVDTQRVYSKPAWREPIPVVAGGADGSGVVAWPGEDEDRPGFAYRSPGGLFSSPQFPFAVSDGGASPRLLDAQPGGRVFFVWAGCGDSEFRDARAPGCALTTLEGVAPDALADQYIGRGDELSVTSGPMGDMAAVFSLGGEFTTPADLGIWLNRRPAGGVFGTPVRLNKVEDEAGGAALTASGAVIAPGGSSEQISAWVRRPGQGTRYVSTPDSARGARELTAVGIGGDKVLLTWVADRGLDGRRILSRIGELQPLAPRDVDPPTVSEADLVKLRRFRGPREFFLTFVSSERATGWVSLKRNSRRGRTLVREKLRPYAGRNRTRRVAVPAGEKLRDLRVTIQLTDGARNRASYRVPTE